MTTKNSLIDDFFQLGKLMREKLSYDSPFVHLSMIQMNALLYIKDNPSTSMRDIASRFHIEMPSATAMIDKLVKLSFVQRAADTEDRRIVRVALTKKGDEILKQALSQKNKRVEKLLSHLSDDEQTNLSRIIKTLVNEMEKDHE
ncbi:MAG TPA: MarR family transcriptional regulator [Patescibacteria group bacterium]|nr:MarR family transcriptional regulator [Patescibacteria group bacterium]